VDALWDRMTEEGVVHKVCTCMLTPKNAKGTPEQLMVASKGGRSDFIDDTTALLVILRPWWGACVE